MYRTGFLHNNSPGAGVLVYRKGFMHNDLPLAVYRYRCTCVQVYRTGFMHNDSPGAGLAELLLTQHPVPVMVHLLEQEPGVVHIVHILKRGKLSYKLSQLSNKLSQLPQLSHKLSQLPHCPHSQKR